MYVLRIIEKVLIIYFSLYLLADWGMYVYALFYFLKRKSFASRPDLNWRKVSIIVPAYNEEISITTTVENLMQLDYPTYEIIVVNDGSGDSTLEVLRNTFFLEAVEHISASEFTDTATVKKTYRSKQFPLWVIDKENGGKADALNAGLRLASGEFICTVDADSILDRSALKEAILPLLRDPSIIISGGQLAVANDMELIRNRVVNARMPGKPLVIWQIVEYLKSFMISRLAFNRINALVIMSGAFSVFRKHDLTEAGGFLSPRNRHPYVLKTVGENKQTVCEDMEIVVRLRRLKKDKGEKARTAFVPDAVCWTEVPENRRDLFKQRARWHQGLGETLFFHREMIFEPRYGAIGMIGLPYYLFFEFLSPVVKIFSLFFLAAAAVTGLLHGPRILLLLAAVMLASALLTASLTLTVEYMAGRKTRALRDALRYKNFAQWLKFIFMAVSAELSYAFFKIAAQLTGIRQALQGNKDWKKFGRKGIKKRHP